MPRRPTPPPGLWGFFYSFPHNFQTSIPPIRLEMADRIQMEQFNGYLRVNNVPIHHFYKKTPKKWLIWPIRPPAICVAKNDKMRICTV